MKVKVLSKVLEFKVYKGFRFVYNILRFKGLRFKARICLRSIKVVKLND